MSDLEYYIEKCYKRNGIVEPIYNSFFLFFVFFFFSFLLNFDKVRKAKGLLLVFAYVWSSCIDKENADGGGNKR